jgi:hypothetical protein
MTTLPRERWGLTGSAVWWSSGQASRQQIYGVATEMMLEVADIQPGSRVLDVRQAQVIKRLWRLDASDQQATYWPQTILQAC